MNYNQVFEKAIERLHAEGLGQKRRLAEEGNANGLASLINSTHRRSRARAIT